MDSKSRMGLRQIETRNLDYAAISGRKNNIKPHLETLLCNRSKQANSRLETLLLNFALK